MHAFRPVVQDHGIAQRVVREYELLVLAKKWHFTAAWNHALQFSFRAGGERTQPSAIGSGREVEEKDIDLVACNAGAADIDDLRNRSIAGATEISQPAEVCQPDGEIDVHAFVKQLDPQPSIGLEARNFWHQWTSNAAK